MYLEIFTHLTEFRYRSIFYLCYVNSQVLKNSTVPWKAFNYGVSQKANQG